MDLIRHVPAPAAVLYPGTVNASASQTQTLPSTLPEVLDVQPCPPGIEERTGRSQSYEVRTFGCQMNVHDSERISGLLEASGYVPHTGEGTPDLVVFNTCAVRENADNKLYGHLGQLAPVKRAHEGMQIAVGGCLAQKDQNTIVEKAPWVDVVFGTHNIGSLPRLLERSRHNREAATELLESLEVFPSTLPAKRENVHSGWVSISVGCNNTCTFCIVPSLRGKEKDRRPGDILAEVQALVDDGAVEAVRGRRSLLAAGVTAVEGTFSAGDTVSMVDSTGTEVGHGLVNYGSDEIPGMLGKRTYELGEEFGEDYARELVHVDNLVNLRPRSARTKLT